MIERNISAVFFDLDGTLADTAPDLVYAINQVLENEGKEALPFKRLRPYVSGGSPALIKIAFDLTDADQDFERLKQMFLDFYEQSLLRKTTLFEGIEDCLSLLNHNDIPWGIITNKPGYLTSPLAEHFKFNRKAKTIICGDTYPQKKPNPFPLLQAATITGVDAENCIYVGDDERDMIAAREANMFAWCAEWGYLSEQNPQDWNADKYIKESSELTAELAKVLGLVEINI